MVARIFHREANKSNREIDSGSKKTTKLEREREKEAGQKQRYKRRVM
jgi:hypothetical protein